MDIREFMPGSQSYPVANIIVPSIQKIFTRFVGQVLRNGSDCDVVTQALVPMIHVLSCDQFSGFTSRSQDGFGHETKVCDCSV